MKHATAMGCHMRPALTNTRLVNLPFEPNFSYPVGSVTKLVLLPAEATIEGGYILLF
jgi:hypothetical protein